MTNERDESHVDNRFDPAEHGYEPDSAERDDGAIDAQEEGSRDIDTCSDVDLDVDPSGDDADDDIDRADNHPGDVDREAA